jgi:hypothetical protein
MSSTPAQVLSTAASALRKTLTNDGKDWNDLPFQEKSRWGLMAAPTVLAVITTTQPEGHQELFNEIAAMANAMIQSQGGTPVPQEDKA